MEKALMFVAWDGKAFHPRSRFDHALAQKFRPDAILNADIQERRKMPRHRLYWSVLQAVCDATGRWPNVEALHWALKIHLGFIEEVASVQGEVLIRPRSTSFARMGEQDFREFMDAALLVITTEITPGMSVEDLLALGRNRLGVEERAA